MEEKEMPYVHRDISWLSFNYRVLQEAKDMSVPLFERIKFLAIYSNNLDEFLRVRVAQHHSLLRVGKKTKRELDVSPKQILKEIHKIVNDQQEEFSRIFEKEIVPELRKYNIYLLRRLDLNEEQSEFIEQFFHNHLLPFVQPVLLVKKKIRPFLNNATLYLAIQLRTKNKSDAPEEYAVLNIPSSHIARFISLPSSQTDRKDLIMLDDIIRHSASWLFPGYDIIDTYSIKFTRDADLDIDDEFSGDLVEKIKNSLIKRNVGPAARFVYDREMPEHMLDFLMNVFDLDKYSLLPEGRYHNNFDFFKLPSFGLNHLKNVPLPPLVHHVLEISPDFWKAIRTKDQCIHCPYHDYESVVRFFEEAAIDPHITHIKIVQYRVAKKSRIMNALIRAIQNGKQVSAFIEVKARFDEEANLMWGEKLEKAGVEVHYSFPGLKVHSKLALVRRVERGRAKLYAYLSTGNFHEDTAKIYSDFGLFTADRRLTSEVSRVFSYLETVKIPQQSFKHLLVGQFNLRGELVRMIEEEIANAKAGKAAKIILKMNSLQDADMIEKLYEASNAGVEIKLIIRGLCSLVPGIEGVSENIAVISIVDRFLEHARIFVFHNEGTPHIYMSSADWMVRNLSHRIETTFPIYDEEIRAEVMTYLEIQLEDSVKARIIDKENSNTYRQNDSDLAIRSQHETYYFIKRKEEKLMKIEGA